MHVQAQAACALLCSGGIRELNEVLQAEGVAMNQAGGLLKVSPDGGLLQSSTIADEVRCRTRSMAWRLP